MHPAIVPAKYALVSSTRCRGSTELPQGHFAQLQLRWQRLITMMLGFLNTQQQTEADGCLVGFYQGSRTKFLHMKVATRTNVTEFMRLCQGDDVVRVLRERVALQFTTRPLGGCSWKLGMSCKGGRIVTRLDHMLSKIWLHFYAKRSKKKLRRVVPVGLRLLARAIASAGRRSLNQAQAQAADIMQIIFKIAEITASAELRLIILLRLCDSTTADL